MRKAWTLLFSVCLMAMVLTPCRAAWLVNRYSQVTVLIEDSQHSLIGSKTYTDSGTIQRDTRLAEPLSIEFTLTPDSQWWASLFEGIPLLDNVGNTFWLSSNSDDPDYSSVVDALTGDPQDTIWGNFSLYASSAYAGGGGCGYSDLGLPTGCSPASIGRIGLQIDAASATQQFTETPEPASMVSLLCGIVGICGFASRRRG